MAKNVLQLKPKTSRLTSKPPKKTVKLKVSRFGKK